MSGIQSNNCIYSCEEQQIHNTTKATFYCSIFNSDDFRKYGVTPFRPVVLQKKQNRNGQVLRLYC
jgi:hypothetical protein